ncbi:MAG: tyrosine--tRNA ligase, partial [Anaerolineae bacterium]
MDAITRIFDRTVAEVIVKEELEEKLRSGRKLRLKLGLDPSKPNLHIGHAIVLRKLRQFQELGHQVVLIVGDWTAQIGDPSGRDETRTMLSAEEVQRNAETYMQQFSIVVDRARTEVRWQSEWFGKFTLTDVFNLASRFTLAQMMAHETFRQRWEQGRALTMMELMYPLLQAYDSVAIQADVEFGGTDQKFNILAGRELQTSLGLPPQDVFLVPLLPGTDGRKMSKSFGNTIDLTDPPEQMYGKAMSISDDMLDTYLTLVSEIPDDELAEIRRALADGSVNPRDVKMRLAYDIVRQFHGPEAARKAEEEFIRVFQKRELPSQIPIYELSNWSPIGIVDLLRNAGLASSASDARRLIEQGGVRIDDEKVEDISLVVEPKEGMVIRVGKRKFVQLARPKQSGCDKSS